MIGLALHNLGRILAAGVLGDALDPGTSNHAWSNATYPRAAARARWPWNAHRDLAGIFPAGSFPQSPTK